MRTARFALALAGLLVLPQRARAENTAAAPAEAAPTLSPDPVGRRAVRGCPPDADCARPTAAMRQVELREWRRDGWVSSGSPRTNTTRTRPSQLRPDQPWLDQLALPDLPVTWNQRLIDYLLFYKNDPRGRRIMTAWLKAQGRYRAFITEQLRAAKLPEDLLYVSMIESSYDPMEKSYAGAAGLWQFMPAGGQIYGLRIDRWVDERNDPLRSTMAVRGYFADLYARFGNWHLALAAYNAGYGAVLRAVTRYNSNDYWSLTEIENGLAWETTLYVPKALAAAIVGKNRELFGYGSIEVAPAEVFDTIAVPPRTSLASIARVASASIDEIKRLNPHLLRGRTPPDSADYVVRVPAGAAKRVAGLSQELRKEGEGLTTYAVLFGERLEDVAMMFGLSTRKLRELNEIAFDGEVTGGTVLVVPTTSQEQLAQGRAKALESLYASGPDMKPGEPLIVPVPDKDAAIKGRTRLFYRVVAGDQVEAIARVFGVDAADLAQWNRIEPKAGLHPRMVVQVFVAPGFDPQAAGVRVLDGSRLHVVTRGSSEHLDLVEGRLGRTRLTYKATRKESLEQVGKKYGLGHRDLARINRMPADTVLTPGQSIVVYAVVDKNRSERAAEQWKKLPRTARTDAPAKAKRLAAEAGSPPPARPKDRTQAEASSSVEAQKSGPAADPTAAP